MGQKVNPIGIRLGITRDWTSRWYAGKRQFPLHVHTDFRVREFLKRRLAEASVSRPRAWWVCGARSSATLMRLTFGYAGLVNRGKPPRRSRLDARPETPIGHRSRRKRTQSPWRHTCECAWSLAFAARRALTLTFFRAQG